MSPSDFCVGPTDEPDKYRLIHQVGSGGEAQLWRAELNVSGTWEPVAVKILRPERLSDLDQWKARWAEQAEVLRFIRHPGVVGVREHFEGGPMHYPGEQPADATALYLVMNWVEGVTLRDWVPLHRTNEAYFEALRYLAQVGDVLDWLHSGQATPSGRPVIHADVTPANVIITATGQAVLVDFGLTRLVGGPSAVVEGTRGYMAPEVLASGVYSPASDRYSFGALAYFVLTGQNPSADPQAVFEGFGKVPAVTSQPGLAEHLMQMFNPDPAMRPGAGDWVRFFRVSGSTTIGSAQGLQATVPLATSGAGIEMSEKPGRGRRAMVVAVAILLALIGGGIAYAVTRNPTPKTAAQPPKHHAHTTPPTVTIAPISQPTDSSPTITDSPTDTGGNGSQGPDNLAQFLSGDQTVGGTSEPEGNGVISVNGQQYPNSIWDNFNACNSTGQESQHDYNLEKNYSTFQATIGLSDTSPSGVTVQWDVYLDGVDQKPIRLTLKQDQQLTIPVTGVLRLSIVTTLIPAQGANSNCNYSNDTQAVWGSAEILP